MWFVLGTLRLLFPQRFTAQEVAAVKPDFVKVDEELIATHGRELFETAQGAGVDILFEASVGGGIPLIRPLRESLAGDRITRVGSTSVSSASALQQAIRAYSPGDRVRLVWTDTAGTTHVATVTLIAGPVA